MKLADRLTKHADAETPDSDKLQPERHGGSLVGFSDELFHELHMEVVDRLDVRGAEALDAAELRRQVFPLIRRALEDRELVVTERQHQRLVTAIVDEIVGLGPLEALLADPAVNDILVNGPHQIYVERKGVLEQTDLRFRDDAHLLNTINRIVARLGRRLDEASPMVDARLPDGSRVNAVIPPLAIDGPALSIRRFGTGPVSLRELVERKALTVGMGHYCKSAVQSKCNVLVCGGTGAGKTTFLNALSRYVSRRERVITIEDSAELRLQQAHVVRLETRPPNIEGRGEVSIRDLVRNALRMRPDRIIVGEVRSSEVLDMIQAMNTGHEGSMTTVHANSVEDAFTRLMSMLSMAGTQLSEHMMLQMIASAIDLVVHVTRDLDGSRRVSAIAETMGVEKGEVRLNHLYEWKSAETEEGRGRWICSGHSQLAERFAGFGVPLDPRWLQHRPSRGASSLSASAHERVKTDD